MSIDHASHGRLDTRSSDHQLRPRPCRRGATLSVSVNQPTDRDREAGRTPETAGCMHALSSCPTFANHMQSMRSNELGEVRVSPCPTFASTYAVV
jgi:hypothetical protein